MTYRLASAGDRRAARAWLAAIATAGMLGLAGPAHADISAAYHCANGTTLTATFSQKPAQVTLALAGGKTIVLPQALSADGGRYAAKNNEFWSVGNGATLKLGGKTTKCTSP